MGELELSYVIWAIKEQYYISNCSFIVWPLNGNRTCRVYEYLMFQRSVTVKARC